MPHEFVIRRNGKLETYTDYDAIPDDFETVIKFLPEIPPGPHTHEQHEEIDSWPEKLDRLMERRNAGSNTQR